MYKKLQTDIRNGVSKNSSLNCHTREGGYLKLLKIKIPACAGMT